MYKIKLIKKICLLKNFSPFISFLSTLQGIKREKKSTKGIQLWFALNNVKQKRKACMCFVNIKFNSRER